MIEDDLLQELWSAAYEILYVDGDPYDKEYQHNMKYLKQEFRKILQCHLTTACTADGAVCPECDGTGDNPNDGVSTDCPECGGSGQS